MIDKLNVIFLDPIGNQEAGDSISIRFQCGDENYSLGKFILAEDNSADILLNFLKKFIPQQNLSIED